MKKTEQKIKEDDGLNYDIKEMKRDNQVRTKHGLFQVRKIDSFPRTNQVPICTGCWYNQIDKVTNRKRIYNSGAPCSPTKPVWCGGYYGILIPITLNPGKTY